MTPMYSGSSGVPHWIEQSLSLGLKIKTLRILKRTVL